MIFCARHIGNERSDATYAAVCEGRSHHDGRQYALRGDEPRCPKCRRIICVTWNVEGDSVTVDGQAVPVCTVDGNYDATVRE